MAEQRENLDVSDISLLYPDADSLRRHMLGEEAGRLSQITAEQLELYFLMDLKSCDFGSFYTCDPEVILYRQQTFEDLTNHPELARILLKMIPLLNDITELRRMGSDSAQSTEAYLYSITEVELYTTLLDLLRDELLPLAPELKSEAFMRFADAVSMSSVKLA